MSFQAMATASHRIVGNSTAKFVLMMLANYADEHGKAWPSVKRLVADTETSERTVQRALIWLEAKGFIGRESRCHLSQPDILTILSPRQNDTPRQNGVNPPSKWRKPPVKMAPKPINEPINEPIKSLSDRYASDYERLWLSFPRNPNSSKARAYKLWKKLNQDDREDCQDAGDLYRAELDKQPAGKDGRKAVMHLSTFITRQMWENYIGQHQAQSGLFGSNGAGHHHR